MNVHSDWQFSPQTTCSTKGWKFEGMIPGCINLWWNIPSMKVSCSATWSAMVKFAAVASMENAILKDYYIIIFDETSRKGQPCPTHPDTYSMNSSHPFTHSLLLLIRPHLIGSVNYFYKATLWMCSKPGNPWAYEKPCALPLLLAIHYLEYLTY